jgi:hypothetical protein
MIVWVLIFYAASGPLVVDNIRSLAACEAAAATVSADIQTLTGFSPPHRCLSVLKR